MQIYPRFDLFIELEYIFRSARTMLANRISFALALHGPSVSVDSACSSSMYALDFAYRAILSGESNAAIVGGANLLLQPYLSLQFARFVFSFVLFYQIFIFPPFRLGVLSKDGFCKFVLKQRSCSNLKSE